MVDGIVIRRKRHVLDAQYNEESWQRTYAIIALIHHVVYIRDSRPEAYT